MGAFINLIGQKFNRLTVLEKCEPDKTGSIIWLCKCDCGKISHVRGNALRNGIVKSCGCYISEVRSARKYPTNKRLLDIYHGMKYRCYNSKIGCYNRYGGRGIDVCQEWVDSYLNFYKWSINNGYSKNLTIDRIDNDKGYSPENCKWSTKKEQLNNTSRNVVLTLDGVSGSPEFWSEKLNIKINTIYTRRFRGWTDKRILSTPILRI